jgi:hypothetical protein
MVLKDADRVATSAASSLVLAERVRKRPAARMARDSQTNGRSPDVELPQQADEPLPGVSARRFDRRTVERQG